MADENIAGKELPLAHSINTANKSSDVSVRHETTMETLQQDLQQLHDLLYRIDLKYFNAALYTYPTEEFKRMIVLKYLTSMGIGFLLISIGVVAALQKEFGICVPFCAAGIYLLWSVRYFRQHFKELFK